MITVAKKMIDEDDYYFSFVINEMKTAMEDKVEVGKERKKRDKKEKSSEKSNKRKYGNKEKLKEKVSRAETSGWSVWESEVSESCYSDATEYLFPPLPKAEAENIPKADKRIEDHYIGVKSTSQAAANVKIDDFALYYRSRRSDDIPLGIHLYLVHKNTQGKVFHFPVVRYMEDNGSKWWHVQIINNKTQSFRTLSDLCRCYHLYRYTDATTGRMEVFPLWNGGVVDLYE